jgi:excisionase family DNA binding protein
VSRVRYREVIVDAALELFTVEEAATLLRIGRTKAYDLTNLYEQSHGERGLAFVRIGNAKRIPRRAIEELIARAFAPIAKP